MTIEDFREPRALRGRESAEPQCVVCGATLEQPEKCFGRCATYPGQEPWIDRLRSERRLSRQREVVASLDDFPTYDRHTVEIQRQPMSVEDEIADLEARAYAKYLWMFLTGLVVGYVLGRFVAPWVFGG